MIRFYYYKHPKTEKIYSDQRMEGYETKPYIAPDGVHCELLIDYTPPEREFKKSGVRGWRSDRECFEADPDYVKKQNPKYIRFQDGHRERYDSSKHC